MLEEAERSCGRLGAIVAEMSDLGKLESGDVTLSRQPFDLAELLAELASRMQEGSDRGVRLEVRGANRRIDIVGDRTRLGAALGALLHAALRERGEPGVVVAECSTTAGSSPAVIVAIGDEATVRELASATERAPFDEWRGGLGLALPVARRVVEAHGGTLWSAAGDRARTGSALRIPLNANQVSHR